MNHKGLKYRHHEPVLQDAILLRPQNLLEVILQEKRALHPIQEALNQRRHKDQA